MATPMSLRWLASTLGVDVGLIRFVVPRVDTYYRHFFRPKSNGELRRIDKSVGDLRFLQDRITQRLLRPYQFPQSMHGCVRGKSPQTNAEQHTQKNCVVCVDIESFYPSVSCAQVYSVWIDLMGFGPPIASVLTRLTTRQGHLPQGVPTSGFLANLAIESAALQIEAAGSGRWTPTFYADDITTSGSSPVEAIAEIAKATSRLGFSLGRTKTKIMWRGMAQRVTGYNVDRDKPSVPRAKRDKIRCAINELRGRKLAGLDTLKLERSIAGRINHVSSTNLGNATRLVADFERAKATDF